MRLLILNNEDEVADWSAKYVAKRIRDFKPTEEKPFVLGLPTGILDKYAVMWTILKSNPHDKNS
jgi:6-phosphogluconolactonase/glucosamine-6-phosphate isomerase/deaminase